MAPEPVHIKPSVRSPHLSLKADHSAAHVTSAPTVRPPAIRPVTHKRVASGGSSFKAPRLGRINHTIIVVSFICLLTVGGLLKWLVPDKEKSERENRNLAHLPKLTYQNIKDGHVATGLEAWYADQFPARDAAIALWNHLNRLMTLNFGGDSIRIVSGNDDLGQDAINPEDVEKPLYTSPFFGTGGTNPNP